MYLVINSFKQNSVGKKTVFKKALIYYQKNLYHIFMLFNSKFIYGVFKKFYELKPDKLLIPNLHINFCAQI